MILLIKHAEETISGNLMCWYFREKYWTGCLPVLFSACGWLCFYQTKSHWQYTLQCFRTSCLFIFELAIHRLSFTSFPRTERSLIICLCHFIFFYKMFKDTVWACLWKTYTVWMLTKVSKLFQDSKLSGWISNNYLILFLLITGGNISKQYLLYVHDTP